MSIQLPLPDRLTEVTSVSRTSRVLYKGLAVHKLVNKVELGAEKRCWSRPPFDTHLGSHSCNDCGDKAFRREFTVRSRVSIVACIVSKKTNGVIEESGASEP